jgi:hypothetical protein
MRMHPFKALAFLGFALAFAASSSQAGGWSFSRHRALECYRQGDFEQVIRQLSPILSVGNPVSKMDSIFAFRLLGVVYAADPKTRELGRHCWMNLLDRDPQANLVDLFVGEELDHLWERARLEHQARMAMLQRARKDTVWMTSDDAAALQKLLDMEDESIPPKSSEQHQVAERVQEKTMSEMPIPSATIPFGNGSVSDNRPYWKRPGTWIAASMAAGVVGFTVYYTFGENAEPPQKLYHVSNETASTR